MTDTATQTPTETKAVPAPVAQAAGLAVEDLLERWSVGQESQNETPVSEETPATDGEGAEATQGEGVEKDGVEEVQGNDTPAVDGGDGEDSQAGRANARAGDTAKAATGEAGSGDAHVESASDQQNQGKATGPERVVNPSLAELEAEIEKLDAYDEDAVKGTLKKLVGTIKAQQEVLDQSQAITRQAAYESYWKDYAAKNPDIGDQGKTLWETTLAKHQKAGLNGAALHSAARAEWETRVEFMKKAPAKATPAPKPAPPKGTTVTPKSSVSARPPQPKPKTVDDKIEAGTYGDLSRVLD